MPNSEVQNEKIFLIDSKEINTVSSDDIKIIMRKVDLQEVVNEARTIIDDFVDTYTEETISVLVSAVESAEFSISNEDTTIDEFDEKMITLENAIDGLVEV